MRGRHLIDRVRRLIKDLPSDIAMGSFWSDREILLGLNAAQSIFCNHCLNNEQLYHLKRLIRNTGYITSPTTVPIDYMHYISALVGQEADLKTARLYLGGDGFNYLYVKHKAIVILQNNIYILDNAQYNNGVPSGSGVLYYYCYPRPIVDLAINGTDYELDFDLWLYEDIFVYFAAVLLATKETHNQRDVKMIGRTIKAMMTFPDDITNYPRTLDASLKVLYATQKEQQGQQQPAQ